MTPLETSIRFFVAAAVILLACRAAGFVFRWIGQPQVVSEMIAGVLLGPTLFGWLWPAASAYVFPSALKPVLYSASQLGLVLYMFLVGLEFDVEVIRSRGRSALVVSLAGIAAPFLMGGALGLSVAGESVFFASSVQPWEAMLFMGASMSITAFPMLARIIYERQLARTSLGTLALAAGSIDDAAAWCVLAVVLAGAAGDASVAVFAVGGGCLFALVTMTVVRRLFSRLGERVERESELGDATFSLVLALVLLGAWFTDLIRIYAVFGAFIMGVAVPRGKLQAELQQRLAPLTTNLLLPMFFVYSGLNTHIGLLDSVWHWLMTAAALLVASLGKAGACYLAARATREPHHEALGVAMLMNARGLMELIILNIGLERGIIRPALFAILVMMAILTTVAATPLFQRLYRPAEPVVGTDDEVLTLAS